MSAAIIPARGGSTRIPRKNIKPFLGIPMLVRAIETAKASKLFNDIYVSTDDKEIADIAIKHGAVVIARPAKLAKNEVGTQEVMQHAVTSLNLRAETNVCCIYPCTPLLAIGDLKAAFQLHLQNDCYAIAVSAAHGRDIGWFYFGYAHQFSDSEPLWTTGTRVYPVGTHRAIDINTPEDWARAEDAYRAMHRSAA